jgi:hypothetical protein
MPVAWVQNAEKTARRPEKGVGMKPDSLFAPVIHGKVLEIFDIPDFMRSQRALVEAFRRQCRCREFSAKIQAFSVA